MSRECLRRLLLCAAVVTLVLLWLKDQAQPDPQRTASCAETLAVRANLHRALVDHVGERSGHRVTIDTEQVQIIFHCNGRTSGPRSYEWSASSCFFSV